MEFYVTLYMLTKQTNNPYSKFQLKFTAVPRMVLLMSSDVNHLKSNLLDIKKQKL